MTYIFIPAQEYPCTVDLYFDRAEIPVLDWGADVVARIPGDRSPDGKTKKPTFPLSIHTLTANLSLKQNVSMEKTPEPFV